MKIFIMNLISFIVFLTLTLYIMILYITQLILIPYGIPLMFISLVISSINIVYMSLIYDKDSYEKEN